MKPLWGAFTPGAKLMMGSDDEGTYIFSMIDQNTLDYCYSETGRSPRTVCARLTRQPRSPAAYPAADLVDAAGGALSARIRLRASPGFPHRGHGTSCRRSDGDSKQTCESSGDFSCRPSDRERPSLSAGRRKKDITGQATINGIKARAAT
jgi:hypothetical protein